MVEKKKSKGNTKKTKNPVSKDKTIKKSNKELKKDIKKMNPKKKKKIGKIILITFLILMLLGIIAVGVVIGLVFKTYGEEWKMDKNDLVMGESNSKVLDSEDNLLTILTGDETRQPVTLDEMSTYLPKAYVAIEDERFYEHSGVDIKRTLGAVVKYLAGDGSYGGSTITQQVVKNLTKEDERAIERKIKEWGRAYNVEQLLSKQQILQLYLNLIYVGGPEGQSLHGVEMGSVYYFNKSAKDLSLAESAFLAGINSSPSAYRPFEDLDEEGNMPEKMKEKIDRKVKTVLNKMKDLGPNHEAGISEEEYNEAIAEVDAGLKFEKGATRTAILSFHTELAINEVIEDYMKKKECTRDFAKNYIYSSGLTIYTTQVSSIQHTIEDEYTSNIKVLTSKNRKDDDGNYVTSQSAMVIIDQSTGHVVGCVGQIGEKNVNWHLNRVTSSRQTGSAMKPLAVIVPGLGEGVITAASVYDDVPTSFGVGGKVKNYYGYYKGLSTIRNVIEISQNVIPAKIITQLPPSKSMDYLEKIGITTLDREKDDGYWLALGGMTWGVSPLEMAGAYATIANSGVYIEPTFYTKVTDSNGTVIMESEQESHRVISEENAYIAKSILTQPVVGQDPLATARICKINGMETCAKTGTTDGDKDRWLCGFTPYYTAAIWYGFDKAEYIASGTNPASPVFKNVMGAIHKDLENKNFDVPDNIVRANVCKDSGMLAGEYCNDTINGNRVYSEVFVKGTVPTKTCECHVRAKVCQVDGQDGVYELANDNCPDAKEITFITRPDSENNTAWREARDAKYMLPTKVCDRHKEKPDTEAPVITLKGKEKITIKVGDKFKDEGATAIDKKDGDLTDKIVVTGKVDTSKKGTYTLTYTVEDKAKNKATKTRKVIVEEKKNDKDDDDDDDNKKNTIGGNTVTPGDKTNTVKPSSNTVTPSDNTVKPTDNKIDTIKPSENKTNTSTIKGWFQ